jgi:hypothetical protein
MNLLRRLETLARETGKTDRVNGLGADIRNNLREAINMTFTLEGFAQDTPPVLRAQLIKYITYVRERMQAVQLNP